MMVWNRKKPSSLWMSPRQSLSWALWAIRYSDMSSVFEVPSVMLAIVVLPGVARLPLRW